MGQRMRADRNKVLLSLLGQPLIAWTLQAADRAPSIHWIGLICKDRDRPPLEHILGSLSLATPIHLIPGGASRQASVHNGLKALSESAPRVLIHDGARCLVTAELFERCAQALAANAGLVSAIPVKDTIKVVNRQGLIESTPDRQRLWAAQTPQGFDAALLRECHEKGCRQGWSVTDDAALFEKCGIAVAVVPGEETNIKVTTPSDLMIAELILRQRGVKKA